jgi:hypothetical protein
MQHDMQKMEMQKQCDKYFSEYFTYLTYCTFCTGYLLIGAPSTTKLNKLKKKHKLESACQDLMIDV